MKKLFSIYLSLLFLVRASEAQTLTSREARQEINQLQKIIEKYQGKQNFEADTNYLNALNRQGFYYTQLNIDTAMRLGEKGKTLCEKINYKKGIVDALINLCRGNIPNFDKATAYFNQALILANEINYYQGKAELYSSMGVISIAHNKFDQAEGYLLKALPIFQVLGNKKNIISCLTKISETYRYQGVALLRVQKKAEAEKKLEEALDYAFKAVKLSETTGDKSLKAKCVMNVANLYSSQNKWEETIEYNNKSQKIYESIGDRDNVAMIYNMNSNQYQTLGDFPKALECSFNALKIYEAQKNTPAASNTLNTIGVLYDKQKVHDRAIEYFENSLAMKGSRAVKGDTASTMINIGNAYKGQKKNQKALETFLIALKKFEELGPNGIGGVETASINIAGLYKDEKKYDSALVYGLRAAKDRRGRSLAKLASAYGVLASIYIKTNQLDSAEKYALAAMEIVKRVNVREDFPAYYALLSELYEAKGDGLKAVYNEKQSRLYQDSIRNEETEKKTAYLSADYAFSKKEITLKAQQAIQVAELKREADVKEMEQQNENFQLQKEKEQAELQRKIETQELQKKNERAELQRKIETQALQSKNEKAETQSKIRLYTLISAIGVFSLIALLLFRNIRNKKKANVVLTRQKKEIEIEKAKSDELLLNILPAEVAEELKEKGYTTAKSYDEITILFSDIVGFTHAAQKLSAEDLVKEINNYFSAFDKIMQYYGLEKIKTIGDAYIAAGGLPEQNIATAKTVVEAGIAMQNLVEDFKQERIKNNLPYFELRIGINTGPVVAGVVGIKKFQYDIWGDTVNMAARMEQSGVPGKINISQFTFDKVKDQFNCIHRGKIEAKNKGNVDMYFAEEVSLK